MERWVEIVFDCLPLRSIARLDIPLDASPKYRAKLERVKDAMARHGTHNAYYLHNARCVWRLTNRPDVGMLEFEFEGTVLTDGDDRTVRTTDLRVALQRETCEWLTEPVVAWFEQTVSRAVSVEFERYIEVGDLEQTRKRIEKMQAASDQAGGYVGMFL